MKITPFLLDVLVLIGIVVLTMLPVILEYLSFRRTCKKKISHRRFRYLLFATLYFIIITIVMMEVQGQLNKIGTWRFLIRLANLLSVPMKLNYVVKVLIACLLNLAIGLLFRLLASLLGIGLSKRDLATPRGVDGVYTFLQKMERKILKYFHHEKWYFAGRILKYLSISLIIIYTAVFVFFLIPVFWDATWIPYSFAEQLLEAGYIYPMISLLLLLHAYFFFAGVERIEKECPEFESPVVGQVTVPEPNIEKVKEECNKLFKDYFTYEMEDITPEESISSTAYHEATNMIARAVESHGRNPKRVNDGYMRCLDTIVVNDLGSMNAGEKEKVSGILINGSLFTDFAPYFLRYISVILSRGDNVIFVCNNKKQIDQTADYVTRALECIYSLHHSEAGEENIDFDHPVWKITKAAEDCSETESASVNHCSVLVTDMNFLTSTCFEQRCKNFIHLVDTVIFVEALDTVNGFSQQMSIFDAQMKHLRQLNAIRSKNGGSVTEGKRLVKKQKKSFQIRYSSNQIKYICFDASRVPGLDKVLKNLLFVDFISADSMSYRSQTTVCCYDYEGRADEQGNRYRIQNAHTDEDLGVLVNMADFAVSFGSGKVALFAHNNICIDDLAESVDANANNGLRIRNGENLSINSYHYDCNDHRVIVAFDSDDNLPMTMRKVLSMTSDHPTLVMIFSRPYLFRDYYLANIESLWKSEQLMRIPVEQSGKQYAIQKILVKANSGGITPEEMIHVLADAQLSDYRELVQTRDIRRILQKILLDCGKHRHETLRWRDYFEFDKVCHFNNRGQYAAEERISLRNKRMLSTLLPGATPAKVVIDGRERSLPIPRDRITQNYIAGQNMLYEGGVYFINSIDVAAGKVYIKHATGGRNTAPYQYIQDRQYHIDFSGTEPEHAYPSKHVSINSNGEMSVKEAWISVTKRPMEVLTNGYTVIDQRKMTVNDAEHDYYVHMDATEHIDKFKQTYRRYGEVNDPVCSSDMLMRGSSYTNISPDGTLVMSVKLGGSFGQDPSKITLLAATMINELLHAMFPSVADGVAVCPVLDQTRFSDEESAGILKKLPKAVCRGYEADGKNIELLIIEDSSYDLGVISVLMSSGDDVLKLLFEPVYKYLAWYLSSETPSDYLYYGSQKAPQCFDFEGLSKLAAVLGKEEYSMKVVDIEEVAEYDICDFCGKRYAKGTDVVILEDGRKMCKSCAGNLVGNNKKVLKEHLERAKIFLESTYGIALGDDYEFCFESTVKIANTLKQNRDLLTRGAYIPLKSYVDQKKVYVEYSVPSANLSELLARELTHVWQLKHLPGLSEDLAEGHIALVGIQYLRFLNQNALAAVRTNYYESNTNPSGEGYRKLVRGLLENPQHNNNPFRYLLESSDAVVEDNVIPPTPRLIESGDYGLPYTPRQPDRATDGTLSYFYYSRLTATWQKAYDVLLGAILNHEDGVDVEGCTFEDVDKITDAIAFDHPELFWYRSFSMQGTRVNLIYGATAEEVAVLQKRIDEVVPKYLEGIDDTMGAYDVALRIHVKIISAVDYDTIALNKEEKEGGPSRHKIDYLRSICGVFLDGKAVCEGYARAMQYLLQKCGIECAEAAGNIQKETGESGGGHAWNIVKIDGDYYYLDTTWDDSSNTVQTVKTTDTGFDYFFVTTEEISRTRKTDLCPIDMPKCDATRANYYYHNDLVLNSYDLNRIKAIAQTAARNHGKFFTFKFKTKALFEQALARLCAEGTDCYEALKAAAKEDKQIKTNTYSYSYDKNIWTITVVFKYQ